MPSKGLKFDPETKGGNMKRRFFALTVSLLFLALIVPNLVQAQITTGTLRGYVVDAEGAVLPGVEIEITSVNLMTPRTAITDAKGFFRFLYIPPGVYTVCAKLEGFDTCWTRGIVVEIARTTSANVTMNMGNLEETIDVVASAPTIDTESSAKTYNVNIEMLATIPIAPRMNFSDVWMALPGVSASWGQSPQVNAGNITREVEAGRSYYWNHHNQDDSYENKVMIDGMEINDSMSGNSLAQMNYEAIQEIDVKTAGAGAEYGNARSAFMNIVSKSGGNTFQGSFLFQWQAESWNTTNVDEGTPQASSYAIPALTISGPIVKDKLWFLGSYKYDNQDYQFPDTVIEDQIIRKTRSHMPYAKLTLQAHNDHTVSLTYQNDYYEIENNSFPSTNYSTLAAAQTAKRGGPMVSAIWRWIIKDNLYFNFVTGYNHKPSDTYAVNVAPRLQYTDRFQGGTTRRYDQSYGEDYVSIRENLLFSGHVTYFADNLWNTGAHEIKVGVDIRPYQHITRSRIYHGDPVLNIFQFRLGLDYADYGLSAPYIYRGYARRGAPGTPNDRYDNEVTVSNQNFFVQDHWLVSRNLTLHLGLRFEHQKEYMHFREELPPENDAIYAGMRENVEFDDSGLAPRIGLTYEAGEVGVFKFHFGRYFEYVGTGDYNNYARNITSDEYRIAAADIGKGVEAMTLYSEGTLGYNPDYNVDMKMEYNDEFVASWEKAFFQQLVFEVTGIYRLINTSYQEDINAIFSNGAFVDRKFPGYDTIWQRTFYKGDDRRTKYDYKGLQLGIKRNFTGSWGLMTNYSFHWRNYQKLAFDPTDPEQFVYSSPSDLDMKNYAVNWSFHFSFFYRFPYEIMLSTFINGNGGTFMSDRTGDYGVNESAPRVTISNGRRVADIVWQAKNSYYVGKKWGTSGRSTDDIWSANFRLSKAIVVSAVRLEVGLDLYNAFNWGGYRSFQSVDIRHEFYDIKTSPQAPRAIQFSLKVSY